MRMCPSLLNPGHPTRPKWLRDIGCLSPRSLQAVVIRGRFLRATLVVRASVAIELQSEVRLRKEGFGQANLSLAPKPKPLKSAQVAA